MLGLTIVMTVTYAPLVGILVLLMGYGELRQEIRNRNRAVDRKLIIEALADFLDKVMLANVSVTVPRTAPAVIDGLDSYYSGLASATPEQVRQRTDEWLATSPDTARRLLDLGYDYVDYCWDMPQAIACQARTPHYRLNGKTEEYVVSEEELGTGGLAFRESPLARFLGQVELPLMSGRASALFAGAYLALVATLFCIWHSAGGMQNFVELFKMLK
jgi:hypothetical protein